jgi:hypothetical protein
MLNKIVGGIKLKKLKKWYDNFIKDMGKANEESFGDKKLDCCGINANKKKISMKNKTQK